MRWRSCRCLIMLPALGFHLIPSGGVKWESEKLVDYQFSITAGARDAW